MAIDLSGFALEPLLMARGRVGKVLAIRITGALASFLLLAALLPSAGPAGAGIAAMAAAATMRLLLGRSASSGAPAGR